MSKGYVDNGVGYFNCLPDELIMHILKFRGDRGIRFCLLATCKYMSNFIEILATEYIRTNIPLGADIVIRKYPKQYLVWKNIINGRHKYKFGKSRGYRCDMINKTIVYKNYYINDGIRILKEHIMPSYSGKGVQTTIYSNSKWTSISINDILIIMRNDYEKIYIFNDCNKVECDLNTFNVPVNNPVYAKLLKSTSLYTSIPDLKKYGGVISVKPQYTDPFRNYDNSYNTPHW